MKEKVEKRDWKIIIASLCLKNVSVGRLSFSKQSSVHVQVFSRVKIFILADCGMEK